jgi:hypothetical protein
MNLADLAIRAQAPLGDVPLDPVGVGGENC